MPLDKYFDKIIENKTIEGGWLFLGIDLERNFNTILGLAKKITIPQSIYLIADSENLDEETKNNYQVFNTSIRSVLDIQKTLYLLTEEKKILIIKEIEKLSEEGQNALLKITEEPPQNTIFFLVSKDENKILPTLLSRLKTIRMPLLPNSSFYRQRINKKMKELALAKNPLKIYAESFVNDDPIEFLENLSVLLRDQLLNIFDIKDYKFSDVEGTSNPEALQKTLKALEGIKYANLNARLQIENLLLNLQSK